ncbi:MAG: helix-turn-helix domain-containing protein [Candidatus Nitricoxidivorans perseverans]|uniref:Helix-turn-helix domain-containing protein n=1 Tax=Candidatus Nitricoxidivorans perseverans TaxID=2975601 RepID=A0AA49IUS4_9PROT|nr:MAG: helix-turn-helix domain-containing protein [Candidatus Nitricoxidivorans perseverans]
MNIGESIRKARLEQRVTLEKIALAAGTDAANLSRIERGKQGFSPEMIERIAQALKLPVSALYSYAEQQTATYRVEPAGRQAGDDSVELPLREFCRLNPENRILALEFIRMLLGLQKGRASGGRDPPMPGD